MTVQTTKIEFWTVAYDNATGTKVQKYLHPESTRYGEYIQPLKQDNGDLPYATAIALGNGYFLTASHSFTFKAYAFGEKDIYWFRSEKIFANGVESKNWTHLRNWSADNMLRSDYEAHTLPQNDVTLVKVNVPVPNTSITPFYIFADATTAAEQLPKYTLTLHGQTSGTKTGMYVNSTVEGQFSTSIKSARGDSGGPATIKMDTQDYIVGLLSINDPITKNDVFMRPSPAEFYKIISQVKLGAGNSYYDVPPDLIRTTAGSIEKYFRGTWRKANFLIESDENGILLGSDKDLINTGSGTNNTIFTQDEIGGDDEGATFVISPGDDVIVGASSNNKLVILQNRLFKYQNSDTTGKSNTIQLKGAIKVDNEEGGFYGEYLPYYAGDVPPGDYYVEYRKILSGGRTDLLIYVEAPNESSRTVYKKSGFEESLWSGTIRVVDFKDGDLGLRFVDSEEAKDNASQVLMSLKSDPETTTQINDSSSDVWNGVKSEVINQNYDVGPSQSTIQVTLSTIRSSKYPPAKPGAL